MGQLAYILGIHLYGAIIKLVSLFNAKAKLFVSGRKNFWQALESSFPKTNVVWFHAASLGEFEQGKPVIEALKLAKPSLNVLVTFFSPSGYEVKKDYAHATVFYLPLDTPSNAKRFVSITKPILAVFIRYELWPNYLDELYKRQIPTTVIAAQFRSNQFAFKLFGGFIKKRIARLSKILVQYSSAKEVLLANGIDSSRVLVCGDSRFDRVANTVEDKENLEIISSFKGDAPLLIMGSGYKDEEAFIYDLYDRFPDWKFIYAPHFVDNQTIQLLETRLPDKAITYTQFEPTNKRILVLNTIGKLAAAYKYGDIAVVGGGFRDGIHNIIEPLAFGLATFFGPNHAAFPEAKAAMDRGIGWEINSTHSAKKEIIKLMNAPEKLQKIKAKATLFTKENKGATERIVSVLQNLIK